MARSIEGLGLEAAGVRTSTKGGAGAGTGCPVIAVDAFQNTSAPGTYSLGDVTGKARAEPEGEGMQGRAHVL